ncbi:MAG: Na+/H+ antiporter subunit E [Phormidesmis sp.]
MRILDISFKLLLWFLITTDTSLANCLIGGAVALLLPQFGKAYSSSSFSSWSHLKLWLKMLGKIALAIPRAYLEAFDMILNPHKVEAITVEKVIPRPTRGLIFLDIFLITFTPKTIVVDYVAEGEERGAYVVHSISQR